LNTDRTQRGVAATKGRAPRSRRFGNLELRQELEKASRAAKKSSFVVRIGKELDSPAALCSRADVPDHLCYATEWELRTNEIPSELGHESTR
jgi:hypothetical protein